MDSRDDHTETIDPEVSAGGRSLTLPEGSTFADRYVIGRVLGAGGSAIVYAAWDTQVRQDIALKVLRPDKESKRSLLRFRREVNIARRIKAPNLVTVYDIGQVDTSVWISMERIEGETLRSLVRNGPLEIDRAIAIASQILQALRGVHEHGVIHRDVKPGNIMITPEGDARLMDLGLARFYEGDETRATTTEHVVGTLEYLSPEQALGHDLDPRSDLYSFGLVLFEVLAGQLPYGTQSTLGHLISHVSKAAPDVRTFRRDVPVWLARLVAHLLEKKPEHRYQSAELVVRDLEARHASRWFGLRRARARVIAAVCVLLVAGGLFAGWREWSDSRFDRFVGDVGTGVALDRRGRELWRKPWLTPGLTATTARLVPDGPPRIVGVLANPYDPEDPSHWVVSILDPQSGEILRSRTLPSQTPFMNLPFSNVFMASDFDTVDVDHDGAEEVVISWFHHSYWPSFAVLYDESIGNPVPIFFASGYHRYFGAEDLDGDGIDELLFFGVNNRLGWHAALAAVSVARLKDPHQVSLLDDSIAASTPDAEWSLNSDLMLVWYALLPPFGPTTRFPIIDAGNRTIVIDGPERSISVGFDGFVAGSTAEVADEERNALRFAAYRHLRDFFRRATAGDWDAARESAQQAFDTSRLAGDDILAEWVDQNICTSLIWIGRTEEAEERLANLIQDPDWDSNIAWSAATAYHLTGDLPLAVDWYRRVLHRRDDRASGRKRYEFLEGTVLALGEMGRWSEALQEVKGFEIAASTRGGENGAVYEAWIEWRSTGRPSNVNFHDEGYGEPDLTKYLELEFALSRNEDPAALLSRADEVRPLLSGKDVLIDSFRAECFVRLGRFSEALEAASSAWTRALTERRTDRLIRAQFDLITERMIRAAREAGKEEDAALARAELDRVRYRPTRQ